MRPVCPTPARLTTARDIATLSQALIKGHARHYPYFSRTSFTYNGAPVQTHNRLMSRYDGMDGIKTGFVNASGFNLAGTAVRDGRRLIAVVLGGRTSKERDNRVAALLDHGFGVAPLRPNVATIEVAASVPAVRAALKAAAQPQPEKQVRERAKPAAKEKNGRRRQAGFLDDPGRRLQEPEGRSGRARRDRQGDPGPVERGGEHGGQRQERLFPGAFHGPDQDGGRAGVFPS